MRSEAAKANKIARDSLRSRIGEPAYEAFKIKRRETYADRKLRQVCIDCEAPLEEHNGMRCDRCDGRDQAHKKIYRYTTKGRLAQRKAQKRTYHKRKAQGICIQCGLPREAWPPRIYARKPPANPRPSLICQGCRTLANEAAIRYRARKKLGIVSLASERRKRDRAKLRELRGDAYVPIEETLAKPHVRMLRALVRSDWTTLTELFDAIGAPDHASDPKGRNALTATLGRLVKRDGYVERRSDQVARRGLIGVGLRETEVRITDAGRAALASFLQVKP